MKRLLLTLLCLPFDGLAALACCLALVLRWEVECESGTVWLHMPAGRLSRAWRYSTTLGHAVVMHHDSSVQTFEHEAIHVLQFEGLCCAAWLLLAAGMLDVWVALSVVPLAGYFGASLAAWLRGEHWYLGNQYEQSAAYISLYREPHADE